MCPAERLLDVTGAAHSDAWLVVHNRTSQRAARIADRLIHYIPGEYLPL